MHGQNRKEYKARMRDSKVAEGLAQKAKQWYALSSELLVRRRHDLDVKNDKNNHDNDNDYNNDKNSVDNDKSNNVAKWEETLRLTEKLLTVNPDPSHLWNHRRTLLLHLTSSSSSSPSSLTGKEFLEQEQIVTATCLQRNPKAYGAWFHRKWSIRHYLQIELRSLQSHSDTHPDPFLPHDASSHWKMALERELGLCAQFLDLDERNFHCWNYRRFVVSSLAFVLHLCALFSNNDQDEEPTPMSVRYQRAHLLLHQMDGSWTWSHHNTQQQQSASNLDSHSAILMGSQLTQHDQVSNPILAPTLSQRDEHYLLRKEWDFTKEKIEQNFSNCSAFHYRSKLLPLVLDNRYRHRSLRQPPNQEVPNYYNDDDDCHDCHDLNQSHDSSDKDNDGEGFAWKQREAIHIARKELELVQNAIFTEPDDQTAWWYHRFIVSWANPVPQTTPTKITATTATTQPTSRSTLQSYLELLEDERESIQELIDAEDGRCKWGYLALHMLSNAQISTFAALKRVAVEKDDVDDNDYDYDEDAHIVREEANQCLVNLEQLDPDRIVRYQDMVQ